MGPVDTTGPVVSPGADAEGARHRGRKPTLGRGLGERLSNRLLVPDERNGPAPLSGPGLSSELSGSI